MSLVNASINLLKAAYSDNCDYYILLSGDAYPIYSNDEFIEKINELDLNKSIFDVMNEENSNGIYKASQWWLLTKQDAKIIINTQNKYKNYFNDNMLRNVGAYDECYFLSVLNKEDKNYKFTNMKYMYVRWLNYTITKHPWIFNRLTNEDIIDIETNKSFFIRKCLSSFEYSHTDFHKTLYIVYIGSQTDQNNILNINHDIDLAIVTSLEIHKIHISLQKRCMYIIPIIWKFYEESVLNICLTMKNILKQWFYGIVFIPEKYTYNGINNDNKLVSLSNKKYIFKQEITRDVLNKKIFVRMYDDNGNVAFVLLNKYLNK
jgi:hypothetical protein